MSDHSAADAKILDGSTWDEFCDALKEAGRIVHSENAPQDAFNKAEGYRYLTRLLRGGLESYLEFSDPLFPQLRCGAHETIKLGRITRTTAMRARPSARNSIIASLASVTR